MAYEDAKHEREKTQIEVDRFTMNGEPTCLSWYGCDKHKREMCQFLLARKFGTVYVCGLTGADIYEHDKSPTIRPLKDCPLWGTKSI